MKTTAISNQQSAISNQRATSKISKLSKLHFLLVIFTFISTTSFAQQWDLTGNIDAGNGLLLGTNDAYPLNIMANAHKHITILPTQTTMVGFGTETPNTNLHIHSNGYVYINDKGQPIQEPGTFGSSIHLTTTLSGEEPTDGFRLGVYNNTCFLTSEDNMNFTLNNGESNMNIKSNGTINFFGSDLPVGGRLNVTTTEGTNGLCIKKQESNTNGYGIRIWTGSATMNAFEVKQSSARVFVVKQNGQTGIGTDTPDANYMLDVAGKMRACEVRVNNPGWCDYVFADDYELMPLAQLGAYISANKHLPEMPSAAEVEAEGGFDVALMSTALLKRAEENTLYIIALEEKTNELEKQLAGQKTNLKAVVQEIETAKAEAAQAKSDKQAANEKAEVLEKRIAALEQKMNDLLLSSEKK
ncbi:MAG: hypothetical protein ACKVOR_11230 [Flavobacteriales bacterium]